MIQARNLTFQYGSQAVFQNLSFDLPEKGVVAFTGPSGCGKTTLLRLLAGLLHLASGSIKGMEHLCVSMVFQEDRLLPWYTAYENVLYALMNHLPNKEELARHWLGVMELSDSLQKLPGELSGGMQRRVALARACAYPSDVLILDEPFKGMDDSLKDRILPRLQSAAPLILLVTHTAGDADKLQAIRIPVCA